MNNEELKELLKSITNRCIIAKFLLDSLEESRTHHLLPTILEDMYEDAQTIALEYCAKEKQSD